MFELRFGSLKTEGVVNKPLMFPANSGLVTIDETPPQVIEPYNRLQGIFRLTLTTEKHFYLDAGWYQKEYIDGRYKDVFKTLAIQPLILKPVAEKWEGEIEPIPKYEAITLGSTTLTEEQLQDLLTLIESESESDM